MVAPRLNPDHVDAGLYGLLRGLPDGFRGEILNGVLRVVPHAFSQHSGVASRLHLELGGPFERSRGGPGGWVFDCDPQLNLGADVVCPDLVAWKAARAPEEGEFFLTSTPDWAAEVLSDATWKQDRGPRMEAWGRRGTGHVWLLEPETETLEVFRNDAGTMRPLATFKGRVKVRAAPFDAVELDLAFVWPRKNPGQP